MNAPNPVWIHNLLYFRIQPIHRNHLGHPSNGYVEYINRKITQLGELIMPAKASKAPSNSNWIQTEFITIKIQGEHKNGFSEWMGRKDTETALDVASFMSEGHKTSITWDDKNACWIVASTCKIEASPNHNCCISSRSGEWYEALCMNVYKSNVMCHGGSWQEAQESSDWG